MRREAESAERWLDRLSALLRSDQMPKQEELAAQVGVAQSLVSRARNGKLRRKTDKVVALWDYASSLITAEQLARTAAAEIDAGASAPAPDGEPAMKGKRPKPARDRAFRKAAETGIKAYLDDGYDPRLIVEQLAVLRRAQQVRRLGRRPSSDHSDRAEAAS